MALVAAGSVLATPDGAALAAKKAAASSAGKQDQAGAQKAFDTGAKAFEAGKFDIAITQLTSAISSGGLHGQQMAKALYYRGVANRKQGKPAQAISDLTSALWLNGGLNDKERAAAMEARAGAYREAGLIDGSQVESARNAGLSGRPAAVSERAAAKTGPGASEPGPAAAAPAQAQAATSSWKSATAVRQAPATTSAVAPAAQPQAAPVPVTASPSGAGSDAARQAAVNRAPSRSDRAAFPDPFSAYTERSVTPYGSDVRERVATAPPAAEKPAPASGSGGGLLKSIFGDLSLGGSAPKPQQAPSPKAEAPVMANAATGGWSDATRIVPKGQAGQNVAAVAPPAAAPAAPVGNYRLQVAAVRTRQEAQSVSTRLRQQHARELRARSVEIDEAVLADIGKFYRVRVGPYADANEPRNLCVKLRQKGYDCLVVSISQ